MCKVMWMFRLEIETCSYNYWQKLIWFKIGNSYILFWRDNKSYLTSGSMTKWNYDSYHINSIHSTQLQRLILGIQHNIHHSKYLIGKNICRSIQQDSFLKLCFKRSVGSKHDEYKASVVVTEDPSEYKTLSCHRPSVSVFGWGGVQTLGLASSSLGWKIAVHPASRTGLQM